MKRVPKKRVLVLMHEDLLPPKSLEGLHEIEVFDIKTEYDVCQGLEELGHEIREVGIKNDLGPLDRAIEEFQPHIVFNLLEEFRGNVLYDYAVVSYLELKHVPYTGCNPRGLVIARDKALAKKVLAYHRIGLPRFAVFPIDLKTKRPKSLGFPLIVKSLIAEGSSGLGYRSVVHNDEQLEERVRLVHQRLRTDAIAEEFIEGRELYVGVIGNHRLEILPTWELFVDNLPPGAPRIATSKVKWDPEYQEKYDIKIDRARKLPDGVEREIGQVSKRIYRRLGLSGYARIDFRLSEEGKLYFLEANPNPDIADTEELASAAQAAGIEYHPLLQKVVSLGLRRTVP